MTGLLPSSHSQWFFTIPVLFFSTYQTLPDIGKEVKDAFDNYREAIVTLNNSVEMANTAKDLIAEVQQDISGDSLEARKESYNAEKQRSEALREELTQLDLQPQGILQLNCNPDTVISRL